MPLLEQIGATTPALEPVFADDSDLEDDRIAVVVYAEPKIVQGGEEVLELTHDLDDLAVSSGPSIGQRGGGGGVPPGGPGFPRGDAQPTKPCGRQ